MKRSKFTRTMVVVLLMVVMVSVLSGCRRPYNTPQFVTIEANQTAFVIPLEGATSDQGQFESVDFLKKSQVATKRIEVPRKWVQTGRYDWQGEYMDTVRVIVVDRFPETREWLSDTTRGTSDKPEGFIGESSDLSLIHI